MSNAVTIWHNPRCTKSRLTLQLLADKGFEPTVRLYLEDVPSADEIRAVKAMLGDAADRLIRTGEDAYKEQGLGDVTDEATLIDAMIATPKLIERPVVIKDGKAAIGRPPEDVLPIL